MTKTLSLATTPPFYLVSDLEPDRPEFGPQRGTTHAGSRLGARKQVAEKAQMRGGAEVANEADGPFSATCLELDELRQDDVRHAANLIERSRRHGVVEVEEGDRPAAAALAAELHAGDVDAVAPAERTDAADHAGDVEVGEHEDPALRKGLERVAVDPHEARLALEEHGAVDRHDAAVGAKLGAHQARIVGAFRRGRLGHPEPARLRDQHRVHVGHMLGQDRVEQPAHEGEGQAGRRTPDDLTRVREPRLLHPAFGELREEPSHRVGEPDPWRLFLVGLGVDRRQIHRVHHDPAQQRVGDLVGDGERHGGLGLLGGRAEMRRHDDLLELQERMIGRRWLLLEHVEGGAGNAARLDRARQRQLVDEPAAGAVDQAHAGLEARQLGLAEQVARVASERRVDRDEVGTGQKLVELDRFHAQALGGLARQVGIVGDHLHAEPGGPTRHFGADPTQADDAQHLAEELHALQAALLPAAGLQCEVGGGKPPGHREQEPHGVLGDRGGVAARRVHDDHAALGGGVDVDRVDAGAGATDDLEPAARLDRGARHLGGAADDEALVLTDPRDQVALAQRAAHLDIETVLAKRVDADRLQTVGDENPLHDFSAKIFCAAPTLAPKSTGCPRSARTCSSPASPAMTSNSAAYPMWPRRKSLPFISPCPPAIVMLWLFEYAATTFSLSTPRGGRTAVSAGLGVALAKSSSPNASTPARVARANRSWRLKTFCSPSASSILNASRRPTMIETAGVKRTSFFATYFSSSAKFK